jgi:hypothetical protein
MGISFFTYAFLIDAHFSGTKLVRKTRAGCNFGSHSARTQNFKSHFTKHFDGPELTTETNNHIMGSGDSIHPVTMASCILRLQMEEPASTSCMLYSVTDGKLTGFVVKQPDLRKKSVHDETAAVNRIT